MKLPEGQYETINAIVFAFRSCIKFLPTETKDKFRWEVKFSSAPTKPKEPKRVYLTVITDAVYKYSINSNGSVYATNKITGTKSERIK